MKTFLAKTIPGKEYMYNATDAFYINPKKAHAVADYLNSIGYKLFNGPYKWHVFQDNGDFIGPAIITRAVIRKNKIAFYKI